MKNLILIITIIITLFLGGCEKEEVIVEKSIYDTVQVTAYGINQDSLITSSIMLKYYDKEIPINLNENEFLHNIQILYNNDFTNYFHSKIEYDNQIQYSLKYPKLTPEHLDVLINFDQKTGDFQSVRCHYKIFENSGFNDVELQRAYDYFNYIFGITWPYEINFTKNFVHAKLYSHEYKLWFGITLYQATDMVLFTISNDLI